MQKIFLVTFLMIASFTMVQCSSDDAVVTVDSVIVNEAPFTLGTNAGETLYNVIRSESTGSIWLEITEKPLSGDARIISIFASHEAGTHNGTYILRNNSIGPGIAIPALLNAENGEQIAGGSAESQPLGTITITDLGSNRFKIIFNDVVLDPETPTETSISGSCTKTFELQS